MNYLIDTHIFLWSLFSPQKISKPAAQTIRKSENRIFVSSVTFWEIALKYALKKLELKGITPDQLPQFADRMDFEILNLNADDAASFHNLPRIERRDPFGRMIIWQAIREKMILISKDIETQVYQEFGLKILK
ncbi:MAG: type II toxin-antitoxin system VapC family toxin [Desulfobacterales bacterium]|nr:type II toxin-antitoxin system VapC family toxin [Desulfobacterales bacterium]